MKRTSEHFEVYELVLLTLNQGTKAKGGKKKKKGNIDFSSEKKEKLHFY